MEHIRLDIDTYMDTHMTVYGIQMLDFDEKKGPVHIWLDMDTYMTLYLIWMIDFDEKKGPM